jgi:hypothetical protein
VTLAECMNKISVTQDFKFQFSRVIGNRVFIYYKQNRRKSTGIFRILGIIFTWISIQGKCVKKVLIPSTGMCVDGNKIRGTGLTK